MYILSFYSVNLFIYWICYHSNCFHSSRSNILLNGLSFVEEISRWLKLHGVKNDVKLQTTEINLLRRSVLAVYSPQWECCEKEIFISFLPIFCWSDLGLLQKKWKQNQKRFSPFVANLLIVKSSQMLTKLLSSCLPS